MSTDYPDWGALAALQTFITDLNLASSTLQATAAQIAAEIAATGVPLLGNPVELYAQSSVVLAAGASNQVLDNTSSAALTPMGGYLAYDVSIGQTCNASSGAPFITYRLDWFADNSTNYLMWQEYWTIPSASNLELFSWGTGPVRGAYLQVAVTNEDGTYSNEINSFVMYGNSRPAPEATSDWRSTVISSRNIPGYTVPTSGLSADGVLGAFSGSLSAGLSRNLIASGYFGQCLLGFTVAGTSPSLTVQPAAYLTGHGITDIDQYYVPGPTALGGSAPINLPRSPLILQLTNNNASNSVTYAISAVTVPR